jgi:hypothetical protein
LAGGPPGVGLQTVIDALPGGDAGDRLPVALPTIGVATNGVVGTASDVEIVPRTAGIPCVICPVGLAQVTTFPGVVGSEASGTGANVVSGVLGTVAAENGLGPLSEDVTIAPGVVGSPMAVVPMVETCAMLTLQPNSRAAAVNS